MQTPLWTEASLPQASLRHWPPDLQGVLPGEAGCAPLDAAWQVLWQAFSSSPSGQVLHGFLNQRLNAGAVVYPPDPLRVLRLTPLSSVKVLILGQDPYHGPGQAEGLAFSVAPGVKLPPSLKNIVQEVRRDVGLPAPAHGSLMGWAQRGVLLLNTCWSVEQGQAGSHAHKGWDALTDEVIKAVTASVPVCVYLLWGAHAQSKADFINGEAEQMGQKHLVLMANHPSPLSARRPPVPFVGCGHFSTTQNWLCAQGIDWHWAWASQGPSIDVPKPSADQNML